eukprot:TRINITY_DN647_c0_g1_i1.p1 TRINITY_DN647_c0_g1~~TRINITY_DN647_c0_g1_i1.p1  ORF type:complete len:430 (+),score=74.57 TRINITY_DN647_c0_g1_i1:55-1344(+)
MCIRDSIPHMSRSLLLFALFFISAFTLERRNIGDVIFSGCKDITNPLPLTICSTLLEGPDCSVNTTLTVSGLTVMSQNVDLSTESAACASNVGLLGYSCNFCVNFTTPTADLMCISSTPGCTSPSGYPVTLSKFEECFPQSNLGELRSCLNASCPLVDGQVCAGHGTCNSGTCSCDTGYGGADCSLIYGTFEKCVVISDGLNVCTRLVYESCRIGIRIVGISGPFEYPLYGRDITAANFKNVVSGSSLCENSTGICTNCLEWSGVDVQPTKATGCLKLKSKCGPLENVYDLGCFTDDSLTPECFQCKADTCSYQGTCDKGVCSCNSGWSGDSCNIRVICNSDCNGRGRCIDNGVCECNPGYSGHECELGGEENPPKKSAGIVFAVLIPLFLVAAGIGAGAYIYIKKKKNKPAFNQFDLLEQDEADQMLD